ncbi:NCAM (neural cell adhesion molecule) homolog [Caenorhabditis elegans]|uniref:NCAM (Neural cell adhesion molecule) homolog n=1 Tax=Caenorhabditis elegans TaxID=6239 RepID=Q8MQ86_CAEEL|nr:NCAM (neural cell adhesion molecule) homolog [Caenorhabditis elegans]CCD68929.1 NCAM (neural cell adhesion molecule) homolog [Caenorhabditis elegans]|eukprot:NP_741709.1 NCAM (neural cell adhesion molecule) homolog [Caenorhabditis elegans]
MTLCLRCSSNLNYKQCAIVRFSSEVENGNRRIILIFFLLLLLILSGWTLSLSPTEERLQNRRSGDNFLVVCKVKDFDGAASDAKIEWYRDGKLIPRFGSTMTIERTYSNQLMINRPKISDGGKYTCKTEIQGEQQEVSAEISFVDPPKFLNVQESQHPEEGTRAEIVCEVEGTDQLEVFWQFNGVTLDETSQRGYEFSENNQILYIPHFTAKKDDGIYNCNAAQYSSFETLSVNVTGYARPTITVFDVPNGNRGIEGHTIELKCGAVGKPKPTYKWFFEDDEVPIARSDKHNVEEGLLIIESLNSEDAGTYKCVANNTVGSNERTFDLAVFLKPKVDLKHEYVVKEGDDVELVCSYHGEGHVTAKFVSGHSEFAVRNEAVSAGNSEEIRPESNESEEVTTTSENSEETSTQDEVELKSAENVNDEEDHTSQQDDGEQDEQEESKKWKRFADDVNNQRISVRAEENKLILTIKSISLEDAADYTCAVSNDAGTVNKVTQVGIIHPPTLRHYTGPHIRSFDGNTVSVYCDVSAVPSPKWHWFKNGKEVEANGVSIQIFTQGSSTKLTLENFDGSDNFGVYTCRADNGVGQLEKQIDVIKVVSPATPSGMNCKKMVYPNYGKCSFESDIYEKEESKPQTMELLVAKLEEMESDYNWSHAQPVSVPFEDDLTIPNLTSNTQYVIKARAVNEAGSSEYSEEISLETTDPWAPQAPGSVAMKCSDYCTVSWDTPNDHGSPLLKFKVTIQEMKYKTDDDEVEEKSDEKSNNNSEETETTTSDDNDETEASNESIEIKENSEEQETTLAHEDSAEILPTDPSTSVERDEMVPYGSLLVLNVDSEENQVQLTNIKQHSYYKISVAAENEKGQGEPAEIDFQTDDSPTKYEEGIDSTHLIIAIAIGVLFLLLLVDLGCFITNKCGLISCICLNLCGKNAGAKQRDLESGRGGPESNRLLDSSGAR